MTNLLVKVSYFCIEGQLDMASIVVFANSYLRNISRPHFGPTFASADEGLYGRPAFIVAHG